MSYFPSISQNVTVDTANSYASTIATGVTWNAAGVGTSTLGVAGIQLTVASDQNLIIYVDQGRTSSSFQITDQYDFNVIKGNFGLTVQAVGAFVRVRAKNITGTTANVLIDAVLCPIVEAVPRSLDENLYLKTAIYELNDEFGDKLIISPVGSMNTNNPFRLAGVPFRTSIDTTFWTATSNGTSALAVVGSGTGGTNGMATVVSGTSNNGYGMFRTVRDARNISGNPNRLRMIVRFPALSIANTTRVWGAFTTTGSGATPPTPVDGFFFSLDASNVLSVNAYNGGSPSITAVSNGSFNGEKSQIDVDLNVHVYGITYVKNIVQFFVDQNLIHTMTATTVVPSSTNTLPICFYVKNAAGGTTSASMECWTSSIHRLGHEHSAPIWRYIHGVNAGTQLKLGAGQLHSVIVNGAGTNSTVSLYDAISATNPIALITGLSGSTPPVTIDYSLDFYTGLYVVTAVAATDVTVVFE